LISADVR